ncbi:MAG: hypothetical protein IPH52_07435 [Leptospiraceae bacterium]|nr:hypothetical protein [Leptospiraceae bacterium]
MTEKEVIRPDHPGEMGAIGIAILTKEKIEKDIQANGSYSPTFYFMGRFGKI